MKTPTTPQRAGTAKDHALLGCYDFGRELLRARDLDPVYVLVWEAKLDQELLCHWLLAYWCYYHVGTASWIADPQNSYTGKDRFSDYWPRMYAAAGSKEYPRSAERRHYRGKQALASVEWLEQRGVPLLFRPFLTRRRWTAEDLIAEVMTWDRFGPWVAFKAADMLERLGVCEVDFSDAFAATYESPRKGAEDLWRAEGKRDEDLPPGGVVYWAVCRILQEVRGAMAPPREERLINFQEAETILCKWHSHVNGRYHVGEDVTACYNGLLRFARCKLAQRLLAAGRKGGLWC